MDALIGRRSPTCPAWSIPLWLLIATEELNLLDADDFVRAKRDYQGRDDERLAALMRQAMYRASITRAESAFGTKLVRTFLGTIAVSRFGWREMDFHVLAHTKR
jgi:hypothetical protein